MTKRSIFSIFTALFIILVVFVGTFSVSTPVHAETVEQQQARLEAELAQIEAEIAAQEALLSQQQAQSGSIERDLNVIRTEIKTKKLEIQKKNRLINGLAEDIRQKGNTIDSLGDELDREMQSLSRILRNTNAVEEMSFTEFLFGDETVSNFFADIDNYQTIQAQLQESFENIKLLQELTAEEIEQLESKKKSEANVKYGLEVDKSKVEAKEDEKDVLLSASKNKETTYEQVIAEKKAKYQETYAKLFSIVGADGGALEFGEAYALAKQAGRGTNVDPAFILAILKQETNIGSNIGTCNRVGDARNWTTIMPGPSDNSWRDDQSIFKAITTALGKPQIGPPLSCPMASGGWGGAMGISQFIPATWATYGGFVGSGSSWSYSAGSDRVRSTLGSGVMSNPWNHLHGITATALYVKDLGASAQTYSAERDAACKYYSGRGCSAPNVSNAFYGDAVMNHKISIQQSIDILEAGF